MDIKITGAEIPQEVRDAIAKAKSTKGLMRIVGRRASNEFKEHFFALNSRRPNKNNFPRQNFWNRLGKATSLLAADNNSATIAVSDPAYAAKVHGAVIKPRNAKALAIPLTAAAYGHSPRSQDAPFKNALFFLRGKSGKHPVLAIEGPDKKPIAQYVLVASATVKPDPDAVPEDGILQAAITEEISDYYEE